ncbi:S8 family peptidase [Erythrobacter insulae]|uniref:S8 family peptidase n=2 Tax=Erythrobacter insulae TaxID=2584124 RepID=A0A547PF93_9SPHN|nr:S8 family peptidase [Erythrobacter insulae]
MVALGVALGGMGLALASPAAAQGKSPRAGDKIANSYICVFNKQDVSRGNARAEAARLNNANGGQLKRVYRNSIRGFSTNMSATAVERMARLSPNISFCEQDQVVTTQQRGKPPKGGGGDTSPSQSTPWGIARVNGGGAGNFATAWVIDSGIDLDHPDLNVDTSRSFNSVGRNADDQNGHGTHVAGTIAAIDNAIGVIGVAPGAPVVAVRVLDRRGSGSTSGVIAGVDFVAANGSGGDVANMSLGGGISTALDDAVAAAAQASGVRFVIAAGNESRDANLSSPARVNGNGIYTISAFAQGDVFASFSNFGNPPVDYASPGVAVSSTWKSGGYNTISGTSMAAPHFAGILLQSGSTNDGVVSGDRDNTADVIRVVQ